MTKACEDISCDGDFCHAKEKEGGDKKNKSGRKVKKYEEEERKEMRKRRRGEVHERE